MGYLKPCPGSSHPTARRRRGVPCKREGFRRPATVHCGSPKDHYRGGSPVYLHCHPVAQILYYRHRHPGTGWVVRRGCSIHCFLPTETRWPLGSAMNLGHAAGAVPHALARRCFQRKVLAVYRLRRFEAHGYSSASHPPSSTPLPMLSLLQSLRLRKRVHSPPYPPI